MRVLEFIYDNHFLVLYAITLVLSMLRYGLYFDTVVKHLPILFLYALLVDVLGLLIRDFENFQIVYEANYASYNTIIYNVFDIVWYLYFFRIYQLTLNSMKIKAAIKLGSILFIVVSVFNPFFQDMMISPQNYAIIVGSVVLVLAAVTYIWESYMITSKISIQKNLLFWISLGIIVFYSFYPITMFVLEFYYAYYESWHLGTVHHIILSIMYFCFIIGYLKMSQLKIFTN